MVTRVWIVEIEEDGQPLKTEWAYSDKEAQQKYLDLQEDPVLQSHPRAIVKPPRIEFQ